MTLLWAESFDDRTSDAALLNKYCSYYWQQSMNYGNATGRYGSSAFRMWEGDGWDRGHLTQCLVNTDSTIIFGAAVYLSLIGQAYNNYSNGVGFGKQGETDYLMFEFAAPQHGIRVVRGQVNGTYLTETANGVLPRYKWFYLEIKAYIHDTNGSVEIRIDGKKILDVTGLNTKNGTTDYVDFYRLWGCPYYSGDIRFDDIYICNSEGTINNDFLGDVNVKLLMPNGVGSNTDWTPSAGDNYACVDEIEPNTSDYVYTTVSGAYDTYSFETIPSGIIHGIQQSFYGNRGTGGDRTFKAAARIGGVNYPMNSVMTLTDTYGYKFVLNEVSPATTSGWTSDEINSAEFGMKMED